MSILGNYSMHQTKVSKNSKSTKFSDGFNDIEKKFMEDYIYVEDIAEGSFSKVYKLREKNNEKKLVALKINKFLHRKDLDYKTSGLPKDLLREISVMYQLDHKYIVKTMKTLYEPE
jgi:serine/threonine protein kinase